MESEVAWVDSDDEAAAARRRAETHQAQVDAKWKAIFGSDDSDGDVNSDDDPAALQNGDGDGADPPDDAAADAVPTRGLLLYGAATTTTLVQT